MEKQKTAWLYCYAEKWEGKDEINFQVMVLCDFCKRRGIYIHGVTKQIGNRKPPENFSDSDYLLVTEFQRISKSASELAEYINMANSLGTLVVECMS